MYCRDCQRKFDEDEAHRRPNKVPYGLGEVTESYEASCPYCHSENILNDDELTTCDICGERYDPEDMFYIDDTGEWMCHDCYIESFDIPDNI
jgi:hypothetical protein